MSKTVFVMPAGSDEISGGNLYNAHLFAALRECSDVSRMDAREFATESLSDGTYLVDTLDLRVAREVIGRRRSGQHFVLIVHHLPSFEPGLAQDHPDRELEDMVLPGFDGFLATGTFTRRWLETRGISERVELLEPPIVMPRAQVRAFAMPCRGLMVCNLIPRKGVLEFLRALDAIWTAVPPAEDVRLDILGRTDLDPTYAMKCSEVVRDGEGVRSRVRLVGAVSPDEMPTRYGTANLFLSASKMETFGISLREARCHGLPLLAVRGGNSAQHVHEGQNGLLFESPEKLAAGFATLVGTPQHHRRIFEFAQAGRPVVDETWAAAAQRLTRRLREWFPE